MQANNCHKCNHLIAKKLILLSLGSLTELGFKICLILWNCKRYYVHNVLYFRLIDLDFRLITSDWKCSTSFPHLLWAELVTFWELFQLAICWHAPLSPCHLGPLWPPPLYLWELELTSEKWPTSATAAAHVCSYSVFLLYLLDLYKWQMNDGNHWVGHQILILVIGHQ